MTYYTCKWNDGKKCENAARTDWCTLETDIGHCAEVIRVDWFTTCCRPDKRKTPEKKKYWVCEYGNGLRGDAEMLTVDFCKQFIEENS